MLNIVSCTAFFFFCFLVFTNRGGTKRVKCGRVSDALYNVWMTTGGGDVQRSPSLAVGLVDVGVMFQKEGHHIHAAIYAGLLGGGGGMRGVGMLPRDIALYWDV